MTEQQLREEMVQIGASLLGEPQNSEKSYAKLTVFS